MILRELHTAFLECQNEELNGVSNRFKSIVHEYSQKEHSTTKRMPQDLLRGENQPAIKSQRVAGKHKTGLQSLFATMSTLRIAKSVKMWTKGLQPQLVFEFWSWRYFPYIHITSSRTICELV